MLCSFLIYLAETQPLEKSFIQVVIFFTIMNCVYAHLALILTYIRRCRYIFMFIYSIKNISLIKKHLKNSICLREFK